MVELERLIKLRRCHFSITYSSVTDFCVSLWLKGYNEDNSDLIIFSEQGNDLDYLICKCKVAYKDWLLDNQGGY